MSGGKKGDDEPAPPAAKTTTAKAAPSASASAAADDSPEKLQAINKPKFDWHYKMKEIAPATAPGSLKPLDNGPFSFAADAPTVGMDFDSPDSIPSGDVVDYRFMDDLVSTSTVCALAYEATPPLKDEQIAALKKCANFKYFVKVFVRTLVKPEVVGGQFKKGSMSGDVFVFNIDQKTFLGGFSFQATNSDKVEFKNMAGEDVEAVQKDLADNAQNAVAERWEALTKTQDFPRAK
ncbi:MAG TPA: hypothetical protein VFB62_19395 [Polyangiaceae bacterium]|nr:hypothetical protein [Polyangiaceae bacterium]